MDDGADGLTDGQARRDPASDSLLLETDNGRRDGSFGRSVAYATMEERRMPTVVV